VPLKVIATRDQRASLVAIGEWVRDHGIDADGPFLAARDLLLRRAPRLGEDGESLRRPLEADLDAARRLGLALDASTLPIQGPPGSGKTWTGARMICALVEAGRRVGITANSHKVIGNLLREVLAAAKEADIQVRAVQKGKKDEALDDDRVIRVEETSDVRAQLDVGANLIAGTAWLWASERMIDAVDVLFVDEAGQMSLANVVAVSRATRSVVLLGDPQQLDQPLQGWHPPGADTSALAHVLGDDATISPDRGLFLEKTWRLHPELCRFTSEVFYENRLEPEAEMARQRLRAPAMIDGVGPRFLGHATKGFDNESPPEAAAVADLARSIVTSGSTWVDPKGNVCPVTWEDVLIVAPYNAQVGAIASLLPAAARVGTVDKFQGQQAPISIYSMTTSSPDLAPRGMEFLYSRNRLNVATSRARCVAVVVASPELLRVRARTPRQMRLANALARFVEMASGSRAERPAGVPRDTQPPRTMVLFPDLARH
jgi:AAA domain-containing protein